MDTKETENITIYKIIVNRLDQFALVSNKRENPLGWNDLGKTGTKSECLAFMNAKYPSKTLVSLPK